MYYAPHLRELERENARLKRQVAERRQEMALLWEAKVLVEHWREEYNPVRPRSSLGTGGRRRQPPS